MAEEAKYSRFKDAIWFSTEERPVLIGGAGGIGSWLTLLLARAGFKPYVYDFDTVEEHNMGGQLFGIEHIGSKKVSALSTIVDRFSKTLIIPMEERFTNESFANMHMFSAFDNMKARKDMFSVWERDYGENEDAIFIDGRLTFEQIQIFCVKGGDKVAIQSYKDNHLFDDSAVPDAPCTLKQTSHTAAMIASHMVGFFTNFLAERAGRPSAVPKKWEYFVPIDYIDRED